MGGDHIGQGSTLGSKRFRLALVEYQPKRGYIVSEFTEKAFLDAYEARASLEATACRRAAENGISAELADELKKKLKVGDRILASEQLSEESNCVIPRPCHAFDSWKRAGFATSAETSVPWALGLTATRGADVTREIAVQPGWPWPETSCAWSNKVAAT